MNSLEIYKAQFLKKPSLLTKNELLAHNLIPLFFIEKGGHILKWADMDVNGRTHRAAPMALLDYGFPIPDF
jgi:hypothetical protein